MFIREVQQVHNADTRGQWTDFAPHRQRVTRALRSLAQQRPARLGIFGAGNCNDLDLSALADTFDRIDLIDLDNEALEFGMRNQAVSGRNIFAQGDTDITGVADRLSEWRPDRPAPSESAVACAAKAAAWTPGIPMPFDVTASAGVLSQLVHGVISTLGDHHGEFFRVLSAIRKRHLGLLLEATKPGGSVFLSIEVVSSDTCPQILGAGPDNLAKIVTEAVEKRNFFTGLNPFLLQNLLTTDEKLSSLIASVTAGKPWLWNLGARSYAVVPFIITRNKMVARIRGKQKGPAV